DARRRHLRLTPAGRRVFAPLERRSQRQVRSMLAGLDGSRRAALLEAMSVIRGAFSAPAGQAQVSLRTHRPGDMGWVVERHGALYFREYGWNEEFEALVAGITADFIRKLDPARERCWIAQSAAGRRLGCIFLVAGESGTAKLRLLLVEPEARGLGVGERHGALYFREYGWNEEFEALVAGITADFIRKLDPARERCWIAQSAAGRRLGCIFLVAGESGTAKLRLLLVEPEARGLGLG